MITDLALLMLFASCGPPDVRALAEACLSGEEWAYCALEDALTNEYAYLI